MEDEEEDETQNISYERNILNIKWNMLGPTVSLEVSMGRFQGKSTRREYTFTFSV